MNCQYCLSMLACFGSLAFAPRQEESLLSHVSRIRINASWHVNFVWDRGEDVESILGVRIYHRASHAGREVWRARFPTRYFYPDWTPDSLVVTKLRGSTLFAIVSEHQTHMNCFYTVFMFDSRTGSLKQARDDLLNLDIRRLKFGVLVEEAGSQCVAGKWDPHGMLRRTSRIDRRHMSVVSGRWRRVRGTDL